MCALRQGAVDLCRADERAPRRGLTSARDARGRDVGTPAEPRWLGHASDPPSGTVWAYGCGRRQDEVCRQLQEL